MKGQVQGMGRTLQIEVNMHARRGVREVILFNRVRESLSQKLIVPSAPAVGHVQMRLEKVRGGGGILPQVENVPCIGWKLMSFTANTRDWSFAAGVWSRR